MSTLSITPYFPFRRVRILAQNVRLDDHSALVEMETDERFIPTCHRCGSRAPRVHSRPSRVVRDLNMASARVFLFCGYRKVHCPRCKRIVVEEVDGMEASQRVTRRLARYVHGLCKMLTVKEAAGKEKAMLVAFNPLRETVSRTIQVPLYYSGLTQTVRIRERDGKARKRELAQDYTVTLEVRVPPEGMTWFVME